MKGDPEVIQFLNDVLCAELTAINQYFIHAMMCDNWRLKRLAKHMREESIGEMKHAEEVIDRILYLDGVPNMQKYMRVNVGQTIPEMHQFDLDLERDAVSRLNAGVELCRAKGDNGSRLVAEKILHDEEGHIDWLEAQLTQIQTMGLQNYLAQQIEE
jgi:bacterioferritin